MKKIIAFITVSEKSLIETRPLSFLAAVVVTATAYAVVVTASVAENKQNKNNEPKNSVISAEKTATVIAVTAVITKKTHNLNPP